MDADTPAADAFVSTFSRFVHEEKLCLDQVFNCDETGLNYRLLPEKTLAASFEKSADGRKKSKDRVTLNLCSNASGSIKLKLHLIGKAQKPRCFKLIKVDSFPVKYSGQKNAWMDSGIFLDWFQHTFVPEVRKELTKLGVEPKAVLVLDNCSAHPDSELLVSSDGKIRAKFLPANVTSLIQPMDQGVIQAVKLRYRKKLLRKLIIEDERGASLVDFIKSVDMKKVAYLAAEAWEEIPPSTLRKSWQKILPRIELSKKQVQSRAQAHSGGSTQVGKVLGELFDDNDDLLTVRDIQSKSSTSTTEGFSHAYIRGIRIRPLHTSLDLEDSQSSSSSDAETHISEFQSLFDQVGYHQNG